MWYLQKFFILNWPRVLLSGLLACVWVVIKDSCFPLSVTIMPKSQYIFRKKNTSVVGMYTLLSQFGENYLFLLSIPEVDAGLNLKRRLKRAKILHKNIFNITSDKTLIGYFNYHPVYFYHQKDSLCICLSNNTISCHLKGFVYMTIK